MAFRTTPTILLLLALCSLLLILRLPRVADPVPPSHLARAIHLPNPFAEPADPPPTPSAPTSSPAVSTPASSSSSSSSSSSESSTSSTSSSSASSTASSTPVQSSTPTPSSTGLSSSSTPTGSQSSASPSPTVAPPSDPGISTPTIIGLSVAGGVAVLGAVAFIIWKLTRKRFSDFDDDGAIRWPELNHETHALPARPTGRAGIGHENNSDPDIFTSQTAATSTADLQSDPYAVPPLPLHNPNIPYRDDPTAPSQYYDPYRGPVPQTFRGSPPGSQDGHPQNWAVQPGPAESIPMNTYPPRSRSPGPTMAYAPGQHSPGQSMASYPDYARQQSPGYGPGYGAPPRTRSPGPQVAYGDGRRSPGPAAAFNDEDAYGGVR